MLDFVTLRFEMKGKGSGLLRYLSYISLDQGLVSSFRHGTGQPTRRSLQSFTLQSLAQLNYPPLRENTAEPVQARRMSPCLRQAVCGPMLSITPIFASPNLARPTTWCRKG